VTTDNLNSKEVGRAVSRISSTEDSLDFKISKIIGNDYQSYRNEWDMSFDSSVAVRNSPIHLDIEMQDFCNQSCVMCPRDSSGHQDLPYLLDTKKVADLEKIQALIIKAQKEGLRSINFGAFSEPLISKNLWSLIEFAHNHGIIDSRVITNGLLLDRYFEKVFSSGLVNLYVSIDAFTEFTYEKIRGKGFNKVIKNLNQIIKIKKDKGYSLPIIRVSFVEMDQNRHEKDSFVNYWIKHVDHVDVQTWSDYKKTVNAQELNNEKVFNCRSPWQRLAVTASGEILPCCDFNGRNLVLGNINEVTLNEAWKSKKMIKIREDLINGKSPTCESCQRSRGITNQYLHSIHID